MSSEAKSPESYVEKPKTFAELRAEISAGSTKAADLAGAYYDRIAQINPRLNVYLSLTRERALQQAERVDALAAKGDPLPPLAGIPVGIKDVLVMQGAPATAGSKILEGYRPPYDATSVAKLEAAGAVLNMAFRTLVLQEVVAFAAIYNVRSFRVMEKIGMQRDSGGAFDHPEVAEPRLKQHALYRAAVLRT